ncbi:MAG: DUF2141 domain-containing protein [Flavobacteriaceae bacterium]
MRIYLILFLLIPVLAFSQNKLNIEVMGVPESEGNIRVAIYDTSETFLSHEHVFKSESTVAKKGKTELSIDDLPDGEFAIALYHDVNGNDELDTNWLGIPKEAVGFSNAKMKTFGPPKFKECAFKMQSVTEIQIAL